MTQSSNLYQLLEEFILKEFDSHDVEYTPRSARSMRRNLNKILNETDSVKEEKKRKRDELDTDTDGESDDQSESQSESDSEVHDKDYDDSEHKYNYSESIILPVKIKYCLGIAYISIIFSVYSSMFFIVTHYTYDLNNPNHMNDMNGVGLNHSNISKSCL
jgi:hypothetical protein